MTDKRTKTTRALDQRVVNEHPLRALAPPDLAESENPRTLVPIPIEHLPIDPANARDAPPPTPGFRYTPEGRLVPVVESRADLTDPQAQAVATQILQRTGSLRAVADTLGVRPSELKAYLTRDPIFAEEMEYAADRHREAIYASAYRRAVEGYDVPIVGGKDKDEIVAYERRYSDSLTKMLLQRHYPEFRPQKSEFTAVKITGNTQINNFDPAKLPKADRDQLRRILQVPPETVDKEGIIDVLDDESLVASKASTDS